MDLSGPHCLHSSRCFYSQIGEFVISFNFNNHLIKNWRSRRMRRAHPSLQGHPLGCTHLARRHPTPTPAWSALSRLFSVLPPLAFLGPEKVRSQCRLWPPLRACVEPLPPLWNHCNGFIKPSSSHHFRAPSLLSPDPA